MLFKSAILIDAFYLLSQPTCRSVYYLPSESTNRPLTMSPNVRFRQGVLSIIYKLLKTEIPH